MAGSSETAEGDLECDISGGNVETFMEALQLAGQVRTSQTSSWL